MAKWVIDTIELKKRQYVVDAYTKEEAIDKIEDAEPIAQEVLSDTISDIHTINEHEYNKDWKPKWEEYKKQWKAQPDYNEGYDLIKPKQRELFEESNDIWRDD